MLWWLWVFALAASAQTAEIRVVDIDGSRLEIVIQAGDLDLPRDEVFDWIAAQAKAVGVYYGRFPVKKARIRITPTDGARVGHGVAYAGVEPLVTVDMGKGCTAETLQRNWVLTHEITHLALPDQANSHRWLEEGMATYVEPWVRVKQGQIPSEQVWKELVEGLPNGLPEGGDRGLDHTATWGRLYWGGALFFFLADVEIRKKTNNEKGIRDAFVGITAAGLNAATQGSITEVLSAGDKAVGHPVMMELYGVMKADPHPVDLAAIWKDLGVSYDRGAVAFDDKAPSAATRVAMSKP